MSEDKELKQWKEKLFYQPKNGYDQIDAEPDRGGSLLTPRGTSGFSTPRALSAEAVREASPHGGGGWASWPYTFGMELAAGREGVCQ